MYLSYIYVFDKSYVGRVLVCISVSINEYLVIAVFKLSRKTNWFKINIVLFAVKFLLPSATESAIYSVIAHWDIYVIYDHRCNILIYVYWYKIIISTEMQ